MGCGRSLPKGELLRLTRDADGNARVDPTARAQGRGAYLCNRAECAEALKSTRPLAHSFRAPVRVKSDTIELVHEWQRSASTR